MALESIVTAMRRPGFADDKQVAGLNTALEGLYAAVADDQKYSPDAYLKALERFKAELVQ